MTDELSDLIGELVDTSPEQQDQVCLLYTSPSPRDV